MINFEQTGQLLNKFRTWVTFIVIFIVKYKYKL